MSQFSFENAGTCNTATPRALHIVQSLPKPFFAGTLPGARFLAGVFFRDVFALGTDL
jgi:hypothetical protein